MVSFLNPKQPPKGRILVLEDNASVWAMIKKTLEGANYLVQHVRTYDEASLKILKEHHDVVLMDAETAVDLRAAGSWYREMVLRKLHHDIDLVVLTGVPKREASELFSAEADYLFMPVDSVQLLEHVRKALQSAHRRQKRDSSRQMSAPMPLSMGAVIAHWREEEMRKALSRAVNYILFDESPLSSVLFAACVLGIFSLYLRLLPEETARQVSYFFIELHRFF